MTSILDELGDILDHNINAPIRVGEHGPRMNEILISGKSYPIERVEFNCEFSEFFIAANAPPLTMQQWEGIQPQDILFMRDGNLYRATLSLPCAYNATMTAMSQTGSIDCCDCLQATGNIYFYIPEEQRNISRIVPETIVSATLTYNFFSVRAEADGWSRYYFHVDSVEIKLPINVVVDGKSWTIEECYIDDSNYYHTYKSYMTTYGTGASIFRRRRGVFLVVSCVESDDLNKLEEDATFLCLLLGLAKGKYVAWRIVFSEVLDVPRLHRIKNCMPSSKENRICVIDDDYLQDFMNAVIPSSYGKRTQLRVIISSFNDSIRESFMHKACLLLSVFLEQVCAKLYEQVRQISYSTTWKWYKKYPSRTERIAAVLKFGGFADVNDVFLQQRDVILSKGCVFLPNEHSPIDYMNTMILYSTALMLFLLKYSGPFLGFKWIGQSNSVERYSVGQLMPNYRDIELPPEQVALERPREIIPLEIYKYYAANDEFDRKRLFGVVYFSSPLEFNDPLDCQLVAGNNVNEVYPRDGDDDELRCKLAELGFEGKEHEEIIRQLRAKDEQAVIRVRERQLDKLGIFCTTPIVDNPIMWAHYAKNTGYCIKYKNDGNKLLRKIIFEYANRLSSELTHLLFEVENYKCDVDARNANLVKERVRVEFSKELLSEFERCEVCNEYLVIKEEEQILNFLRNLYIHCFDSDEVNYYSDVIEKPLLFSPEDEPYVMPHFYSKSKEWSEEQEYRFTLSLGGKFPLNLGAEFIESITFGLNTSDEEIIRMRGILKELGITHISLYKMKKNDNGQGLIYTPLDVKSLSID